VASDRKIGLLSGNLLRHFEYKVQNGDLLLRPTTTDGPEANNVLGQMPPLKRTDAYTSYLTEDNYKQKYARDQGGRPNWRQPVTPATPVDPKAEAGKPLTMDQLTAQAKMDSQYYAYMAAGSKALSEQKYNDARAHFILASRFKPDTPEAKECTAICDGAQALAEGDAARKAGDTRTARRAYMRAKQVCPTLSKIADAQLRTVGFFHRTGGRSVRGTGTGTGALDRNVAQEVQQGRTANALTMATNALRADPNSLQLRTMKAGLEGLQMAEALYGNLKGIVGRGQQQCSAIQKVEPLDGKTAQMRAELDSMAKVIDTNITAARARYSGNVYAGLGTTVTDARATATKASQILDKINGVFAAKAAEVAKKDQVDMGIITIRLDKESKRVKQLNSYAANFKALAAEAAALAK
jgi:hypothetical protein